MSCDIFLTLPGNIKMPALGYGTWQAADDSFEKALEVALETGYRHIDTAARYENEEIVGRVLKRWFDSGKLKRNDVFITTKLSWVGMKPENVEDRMKESLKKLQLDYVDLYLMHFPISIVMTEKEPYGDPDVDYVDVWNKIEDQYYAGRAKAIGISNFSVKKIERLLKTCRVKPANNQVEMHIHLQQKELLECCNKNGITMVAYAPLGTRGYNDMMVKVGKPTKVLPDMLNDQTVTAIAVKHSKTPAQVLLRFLLQMGVAAIPKSVTPSRIKQNFDVFNFVLDEEDMRNLRKLDKGPAGRICDFKVFARVVEHPEYEF